MENTQKAIPVRELPIRLGQFLKLVNLVQDGLEARLRIEEGEVMVNDVIEKRRGKKLFAGDRVTLEGVTWIVAGDT